MNRELQIVFASADSGLLAHWQGAFGTTSARVVVNFLDLQKLMPGATYMVWLDLTLPGLPKFEQWAGLGNNPRVRYVATSSNPADREAIQALDAGCAGYCHAFSDPETLRQVRQVVEADQVWVGVSLMRRLVQSAAQVAPVAVKNDAVWVKLLTQREREVAIWAANGASNTEIAQRCGISERTVKAHLSSIFDKLNLTDRLHLALRVHGIS